MATTEELEKDGYYPAIVVDMQCGRQAVYMGWINYESASNICVIKNARQCIYYAGGDHKGVLDLGVNGPAASARISPMADTVTCRNVLITASCSKKAIEAWEKEPWR